jgi:hypothetical protein
MATLSSDTSPDIEALQVELMRRAPDWRKLQIVAELNRTVQTLALVGLRERYPDASPSELRRRLADLVLGPELAARAYSPLEAGPDHAA